MYEFEPAPQSLLNWALSSLGPTYIVLLPLSALLSFALVIALLIRGRGPMAAASVLLLVHVPLMIGIYAAVQGLINMYSILAFSGSTPKPSEVAAGMSTALFAPLVALMLMAPSYLIAMIGTFVRSFMAESKPREVAR